MLCLPILFIWVRQGAIFATSGLSQHTGTKRPILPPSPKPCLKSVSRRRPPKPDAGYTEVETLGWKPACKCNAPAVPSTVLDPFAGSGTTLEVARRLGRLA